jgi:hypothetical protein
MQRVAEAAGRWARFEADWDNRSYRLYFAADQRDPLTPPPGGFEFLIQKGFEVRIVDSITHPLIRELLGQKV